MAHGLRSVAGVLLVSDGTGRDRNIFLDHGYRHGFHGFQSQPDLRKLSPAWKFPPARETQGSKLGGSASRASKEALRSKWQRHHDGTAAGAQAPVPKVKPRPTPEPTYADLGRIPGWKQPEWGVPAKHHHLSLAVCPPWELERSAERVAAGAHSDAPNC
eukprot:TRINITY_DN22527_c0_g1_i1.p1 TRINITY_DN22527_c0_g1~~TRINITY_DN22527_c0_g1_i1.p1  ORF type:complete len:180 (-),score=33.56 TRINITY_DN22527_c0_g1_i1:147-623(-)